MNPFKCAGGFRFRGALAGAAWALALFEALLFATGWKSCQAVGAFVGGQLRVRRGRGVLACAIALGVIVPACGIAWAATGVTAPCRFDL